MTDELKVVGIDGAATALNSDSLSIDESTIASDEFVSEEFVSDEFAAEKFAGEESKASSNGSSPHETKPGQSSQHGEMHARARRGIASLMGRQVVVQLAGFAGGVVLARILTPAEFGIYAIALFLVNASAVLGDFGLAPSFIQRKEEFSDTDLRVGFTLQLILTSIVVTGLLIASPSLARLYPKAPADTVWLVRVLAFSLYFVCTRSISALQLERHLNYRWLAIVESIESVTYQVVAVVLALAHFGVWSFVWATLIRGMLGASMLYIAAPFKVRLGFSWSIAKEILRFGIPFQSAQIVARLQSAVAPLLVAHWIGPGAVGFLSWAVTNGRRPSMLMDNVMKVSFPHFSRIQDDKAEVKRTLVRYICLLELAFGVWLAVTVTLGPALVGWIFTRKWLPAVPALTIYSAALLIDVIAWTAHVTMNATGMVGLATRRALMRAAIHLSLTIPAIWIMGYNGVPVAYAISQVIFVVWVFSALYKGEMNEVIGGIRWVAWPIVSASALGYLSQHLPIGAAAKVVVGSAVIAVTYGVLTWMASPPWLKESMAQGWRRLESSLPPTIALRLRPKLQGSKG